MSTLDSDLDVAAEAAVAGGLELSQARQAAVGTMTVSRLLPRRLRRSVGAWCFVDHYGPMSVDGVAGMAVPPHPHIGLQTVTWLFAGDVLHRDSLGTEQMIRPGQLNLMTSGRGIAHSEESPAERDPLLHGVQLWLALPDVSRFVAPAFEHHHWLPAVRAGGFDVTVLIGAMAGQLAQTRSPATTYSDIVGAQLSARWGERSVVDLDPSFEHVLFAAEGAAQAAGTELLPGSMLYLPQRTEQVEVSAAADSTLMLLGGRPLGEPLLMWWNFVARTPAEIADAAAAWRAGSFGDVAGYSGDPLAAPPLDPTRLIGHK